MEIKHNVYFDGDIESLGFVTPEGTKITAGLMKKGTYNFGKANPRETIKCTSGELIVNGVKATAESDSVVIEVGEEINFEAVVDSTYTCIYG